MPVGTPVNNEAVKSDLDKTFLSTFPKISTKLFRPCTDTSHRSGEGMLSKNLPKIKTYPQIKIKLWRPCFMTSLYNPAQKSDKIDFIITNKDSVNFPFKSFTSKPAYRQVCVQFDGGGTDGCSEDS